jgi:5-oxoprolinase (ATP-hydrolysing)
MTSKNTGWQFWIDRGGTFTDIVAKTSQGELRSQKLLSVDPEHYQDAAVEGIRRILDTARGNTLNAAHIESIKMGTTVGTNALLERKGEPTALISTRGFRDVLRIAYQNRPDIFALNIKLPELLYETVIEVNERYDAHGKLIEALDIEKARTDLEDIFSQGIHSLAIVLMHAYRYPEHELKLREIAEEIGFSHISLSHQVSPLMKYVSRGETTVVDAYLSPVLKRYVDMITSSLNKSGNKTNLMFMQSNGGLTDACHFKGKDCILSGPAGGIVGAVKTSEMAGFDRIITFDMGGTSTDVAHYSGEYERSFETEIAGIHLRSPMLHIHTVAAGGGSIIHFDSGRFRVGPDSAGSQPGPACYRKGGPLTVTDCNLMLGKIQPAYFPRVFGKESNMPLDMEIVKLKFTDFAKELSLSTGEEHTAEEVAEGFLKIAIENMASAIKKISIQRGYDIKDYALCCFGGAGAQHACRVADSLGLKKIIIHPLAGVLSAYGMGLADQIILKERSVEELLNDNLIAKLKTDILELAATGKEEMLLQGVLDENINVLHKVQVKYKGTDTPLLLEMAGSETIIKAFNKEHKKRFGFIIEDKEHVIESISVEIIGNGDSLYDIHNLEQDLGITAFDSHVNVFSYGKTHHAPVYFRKYLAAGDDIRGPAIIIEDNTTIVVEPGWKAAVATDGNMLLTKVDDTSGMEAIGTEADPVMLEIFNSRFMSIAEQMGYTLQNTAYSVNIKERLDFSCAVFDRGGNLVANAPHIPVHLGSMGESVRSMVRQFENMQEGDAYMLNSPFDGGTHLPDITVVTPVFYNNELAFYVASRGHHADIGGISPGSMPPGSTHIEEEGLLTRGFKLMEKGHFCEEELKEWLLSGKYPARNPQQNVADLKAQVAANEKGAGELRKLVEQFSLGTVNAYMQHVQDNAEMTVRNAIALLEDGGSEQIFDDGSVIKVKVSIEPDARTAVVDFTGSSGQHPGNLNAPTAVCKAAVLYVFRTLVQEDIPLNEGCLKPIKIIIPKASILNPVYPAAVVAGNVETSQHIVDALLTALGVMAGSQGTMNNFTFGNEKIQYYETICGGSGAGNGFHGTDAVQTHMTNSRITDPEVLEWRFPVRLEEFSIRRGSGGDGAFKGGDGSVRKIRFIEPMNAAIISSHREVRPSGIKGGEDGECGHNYILKKNGDILELSGRAELKMNSGDLFVIETPGGGGFGTMKTIK